MRVVEDKKESLTFNISVYEVVLLLAVVMIIVGIVFCFQTSGPGEILILLAIWIICGYITKKILPTTKCSFAIGLLFGIIGVIVAIILRVNKGNNNIKNINKYDELEKLQKLKEAGAINEIEFESEKRKILN